MGDARRAGGGGETSNLAFTRTTEACAHRFATLVTEVVAQAWHSALRLLERYYGRPVAAESEAPTESRGLG
jgi:hypothetical protein